MAAHALPRASGVNLPRNWCCDFSCLWLIIYRLGSSITFEDKPRCRSEIHGLVRLSLHVWFCNTTKIHHATELCGAATCVQIVQNLALLNLTLRCHGSHTA